MLNRIKDLLPEESCLVDSVFRQALTLISTLLSADVDYVNHGGLLNVEILMRWLELDHPGDLRSLTDKGLRGALAARLQRFVIIYGDIEEIKEGLSLETQHELSVYSTPDSNVTALDVALEIQFPYWSDSMRFDALSDTKEALGLYVEKNLWTCQQGFALEQQSIRKYKSTASSHVVIQARALSGIERQTCLLASTEELPEGLRSLTSERSCLVVRLRNDFAARQIFDWYGGGYSFYEMATDEDPCLSSIELILSVDDGRTMFNWHAIEGSLFEFRTELPVVYVSDTLCILAVHPFNPFYVNSLERHESYACTVYWESVDDASAELLTLQRTRFEQDGVTIVSGVKKLTANGSALG